MSLEVCRVRLVALLDFFSHAALLLRATFPCRVPTKAVEAGRVIRPSTIVDPFFFHLSRCGAPYHPPLPQNLRLMEMEVFHAIAATPGNPNS